MTQVPPAVARETIRQAYRIAARDLRACCNPDGIVAGRLHFNAYWARDGFFASFGALALGDVEQVRAQLDTFIQFNKNLALAAALLLVTLVPADAWVISIGR